VSGARSEDDNDLAIVITAMEEAIKAT